MLKPVYKRLFPSVVVCRLSLDCINKWWKGFLFDYSGITSRVKQVIVF